MDTAMKQQQCHHFIGGAHISMQHKIAHEQASISWHTWAYYKRSQLFHKPCDMHELCYEWSQLFHSHYLQNVGWKSLNTLSWLIFSLPMFVVIFKLCFVFCNGVRFPQMASIYWSKLILRMIQYKISVGSALAIIWVCPLASLVPVELMDSWSLL